ncbi:MAG: hypothetical protein ABSE73_03150 [Planctomycetota bacterium]
MANTEGDDVKNTGYPIAAYAFSWLDEKGKPDSSKKEYDNYKEAQRDFIEKQQKGDYRIGTLVFLRLGPNRAW